LVRIVGKGPKAIQLIGYNQLKIRELQYRNENTQIMLDQLIKLVKQNGGKDIVQSKAIPDQAQPGRY
jgi:hypothetical protein